MNNKLLAIVGVTVVVVAGAWYLISQPAASPSESPTPSVSMSVSPHPTPTPTPTMPAMSHMPTPTKTPTPTPTASIIIHESAIFNVKIENFAFTPASVTVKKGDVVVFKNMDSTTHTVTSVNGSFGSGMLGQGSQWTLTTANLAPGTYQYQCSIHPSMQGTVIVQ